AAGWDRPRPSARRPAVGPPPPPGAPRRGVHSRRSARRALSASSSPPTLPETLTAVDVDAQTGRDIDRHRCEGSQGVTTDLSTTASPPGGDDLVEQVRARYAAAALAVTDTGRALEDCGCGAGGCCGDVATAGEGFGGQLYSIEEQGELPDQAVLASLGCGNPLAVASLEPGETVL